MPTQRRHDGALAVQGSQTQKCRPDGGIFSLVSVPPRKRSATTVTCNVSGIEKSWANIAVPHHPVSILCAFLPTAAGQATPPPGTYTDVIVGEVTG